MENRIKFSMNGKSFEALADFLLRHQGLAPTAFKVVSSPDDYVERDIIVVEFAAAYDAVAAGLAFPEFKALLDAS